jgi:hypothetical protein
MKLQRCNAAATLAHFAIIRAMFPSILDSQYAKNLGTEVA